MNVSPRLQTKRLAQSLCHSLDRTTSNFGHSFSRFVPKRTVALSHAPPKDSPSHHSPQNYSTLLKNVLFDTQYVSPDSKRNSPHSTGSPSSNVSSAEQTWLHVTGLSAKLSPMNTNSEFNRRICQSHPTIDMRIRSKMKRRRLRPPNAKQKQVTGLFDSPRRILSFGTSNWTCHTTPKSNKRSLQKKDSEKLKTCIPTITPLKESTQSCMVKMRERSFAKTKKALNFDDLVSGENVEDRKKKEKSKNAFLVLDAPDLVDDFYSNPLDWSKKRNMILCGLKNSVYTYHVDSRQEEQIASTTQRRHKRSFATRPQWNAMLRNGESPLVTAVAFDPSGDLGAVGTNAGRISIWDIEKQNSTRWFNGPGNHNGVVRWSDHWNHSCLISASKVTPKIMFHDLRAEKNCISEIHGRNNTVSIQWSPDQLKFAVGARDYCVSIWDIRNLSQCSHVCQYHKASVRALAWSPHNYNVLATGGGCKDTKICVWNLSTPGLISYGAGVGGMDTCADFQHSNPNRNPMFSYDGYVCVVKKPVRRIHTNTQITNLLWDPNSNRVLSTQGYVSNDITLWDGTSLEQISKLGGHDDRVLFVALGCNGSDIVTGSGDETLRFWKAFGTPSKAEQSEFRHPRMNRFLR